MKQSLRVFGFVFIFSLIFSTLAFSEISKSKSQSTSPVSVITQESLSEVKSSPLTSEPFLVSASRLPSFKREPKDFPANVSIVSKNQLDQIKPAKFQEAAETLEGVNFFDSTGNAIDTSFGIRGFASGSDAIFLVDGVRVNEVDGLTVLLPLIRMDNVESIEVARGSSSAVYGSGAFGGVVNIKTKQPNKKPLTFFGGDDWSSFGGIHFYNGISGTISDKLTGLGGGLGYYFEMGRTLNRGFRSNDDFRSTDMDFKLNYELPDDEGGIRFGYKNVQDTVSNPGALTLQEYRQDYSQSLQLLDGRKMRNKILFLNANKKFWDDRLNTSIQASIRRHISRFWTTFRTFTDSDGFDPDTDLVTTRSHEKNLIMQLTYQDTWDWLHNESLFGVELNRGFNHDIRQDAFRGNVVETTAKEAWRNGEDSSVGIFGHERIKLWDQFSQEFGIRGNYDWLAFVDETNHSKDFNRRWRDLSVSTGTVWGPVKWGELFWNYSQAFRVPAFFQVNNFNGDPSANLNPEKANNFEVGTRLRYHDKAQLKFSYFHIVTRNEIVYDSSTITMINQFGRNVNAGKTRRNGVEIRGDWQMIDEASIFGSYALTRAIIKSGVSDPTSSGSPFQHRSLGQIPENRFTFGLNSQPLKRFGAPYDGFHASLDAIFVGRQHVQSFESTTQDLLDELGGMIKPYQVWNFRVWYEWHQKEIFFKINNLFDQRYFSRAVDATSFGTSTTPAGNYLFVNPAPPREFVVGTRYEFD